MAGTRGRFITFEGGEGTGKSTQSKRLAAALEAGGLDVVLTREPGGSPAAEAIRGVLLSGRARPLGVLGEAYLFAAARIDHVAELIEPSLVRGAYVICDRFADSSRVYQGTAGGLPADVVDSLVDAAIGSTVPDLTVIIDVPVAVGLARVGHRSEGADRFESDAVAVHEERRRGFLALADRFPERCVVVDGSRDKDVVSADILALVTERFGLDRESARGD
ncbi:Thymidylate kinase [uncultured Pleomorphomonas sp.]|uniref:Thymidylate kinase n=1 Tax=uncultured Pleomorphomonas sp. TaxID=442121 RepID=A0A212KYW0_9HYPH|nr:dTMP kinase [uncultured Pleomorphomonas sp.]SCM70437.1 Thymidylate kinase [uncultured Pleomorphomonas sp.]